MQNLLPIKKSILQTLEDMEPKTIGFEYNQLLKEAIVQLHTCQNQELQLALRREFQKLEAFDVQKIHYMEVISHGIMPKMYFLEKGAKEVTGVNLSRFVKQKEILETKIRLGLRNIDELRLKYQPHHQFKEDDSYSQKVSIKEEISAQKSKKFMEKTVEKPVEKSIERTKKKGGKVVFLKKHSSPRAQLSSSFEDFQQDLQAKPYQPQLEQQAQVQPQPQFEAQIQPKAPPQFQPQVKPELQTQFQGYGQSKGKSKPELKSKEQSKPKSQLHSQSAQSSSSSSSPKPPSKASSKSSSLCEIIQPSVGVSRPSSTRGRGRRQVPHYARRLRQK